MSAIPSVPPVDPRIDRSARISHMLSRALHVLYWKRLNPEEEGLPEGMAYMGRVYRTIPSHLFQGTFSGVPEGYAMTFEAHITARAAEFSYFYLKAREVDEVACEAIEETAQLFDVFQESASRVAELCAKGKRVVDIAVIDRSINLLYRPGQAEGGFAPFLRAAYHQPVTDIVLDADEERLVTEAEALLGSDRRTESDDGEVTEEDLYRLHYCRSMAHSLEVSVLLRSACHADGTQKKDPDRDPIVNRHRMHLGAATISSVVHSMDLLGLANPGVEEMREMLRLGEEDQTHPFAWIMGTLLDAVNRDDVADLLSKEMNRTAFIRWGLKSLQVRLIRSALTKIFSSDRAKNKAASLEKAAERFAAEDLANALEEGEIPPDWELTFASEEEKREWCAAAAEYLRLGAALHERAARLAVREILEHIEIAPFFEFAAGLSDDNVPNSDALMIYFNSLPDYVALVDRCSADGIGLLARLREFCQEEPT